MKTYVIESGSEFYFYPPLTREEKVAIFEEFVYQPLRIRAKSSNGELVIREELTIIGRAIIDATDEAAKNLRLLGFHLILKKTR